MAHQASRQGSRISTHRLDYLVGSFLRRRATALTPVKQTSGSLRKSDEVICASIGAQFKATRRFRQYIPFISRPHTQHGFRTLAASDDSFTTSISLRHLGLTQRYLSFFFMAMIGSRHFDLDGRTRHSRVRPNAVATNIFLYVSSVFSCRRIKLTTRSYI